MKTVKLTTVRRWFKADVEYQVLAENSLNVRLRNDLNEYEYVPKKDVKFTGDKK
jgi:hypothetical protein